MLSFLSDVTTLRKGLEVTRDLTSKLITDAKTLETQLGNVRTDVKGALGACSTGLCTSVSAETDKLKVNIEFTKVCLASIYKLKCLLLVAEHHRVPEKKKKWVVIY